MEPKHKIVTDLLPLATPLGEIELDPRNANTHPPEQLAQYAASLDHFGQRRPVVVNKRNGHLEAGEGLVRAARSLDWTHVAAIYVDDDPNTAIGYALADNRVAQGSEWDPEQLARNLKELVDAEEDLVGFTDDEVRAILGAIEEPGPAEPPEEPTGPTDGGEGEERTKGDDGPSVKTYTLFIPGDDQEDFDAGVKNLGRRWGSDNLTDVVLRAVREADGLA